MGFYPLAIRYLQLPEGARCWRRKSSSRKTRRMRFPGALQFKEDPQTVQEGGLVFALFSLVLAVGNRLFQ